MDLAIVIYRAVENGQDFIFVDINSHVEEIEQVKKEDIIGLKVTEVFPGVEEFGLLNVFKRVYQTGVPENHPISMYTDNRISGWRENYVYKLESGEVVAVYKDETERKRMEEDLRVSWDEKNVIIEGAADPIVVSNEEEILFLNNKAVEFFGFKDSQELIGTPFLGLFSEEVQDILQDRARRRLRGETVPAQYESVILKPDGRLVPVEFNISIIEYEGAPAVLNVIRDISVRKQAEDALRASETLFRGFMQSATESFLLLDKNMHYLDVNNSWLEQSGLIRENVIGKHVLEVDPKLKETGRYDAYLQVLETGEPVEFRSVESTYNLGTIFDLTAFKTGDGLGIIVTDVSDRIKYQRRLETLHGHAAALASADTLDDVAKVTENFLDHIIGSDLGGMSFVEGDQLVTKYIWKSDPLTAAIEKPLNGTGLTVEAVNTGKTLNIGDVRDHPLFMEGVNDWVILSELVVPILVDGKAVGVINMESEKLDAFSENDQRLVETLAEHVASAYSKIQFDEKLSALHSISLELGITKSEEEIVETTFRIMRDVLMLPNSSLQILRDNALFTLGVDLPEFRIMMLPLDGKGVTARVAREARTVRLGDVRLDPDFVKGSTDSRSELAVPMMVENQVIGVLNVESEVLDAYSSDDERMMEVLAQNVGSALSRVRAAQDTAELERQVLVREVQVEQAREISELKTRFITTATHELRTPVTSILGYIELILTEPDRELPTDIRQDLEVVFRNADRLVKLTNDLLDVQRISSGRFEVQREKVDIIGTLFEMLEELSPLFEAKQQIVDFVSPKEFVMAVDELRISQLFINLLRNANKFTPAEGKITVTVEPFDSHVQISVKDTGVGLSEEDIDKLFVPFPGIRHGLNVTSTGLGLAICKGIVELHDGEIWAESDGLDKGSTFYIRLPLTQ